MSFFDLKNIISNFDVYVNDSNFIENISKNDIIRILDEINLNSYQFKQFFLNLSHNHDNIFILSTLKHAIVNIDYKIEDINSILQTISRILKIPLLFSISDAISRLITPKNDDLLILNKLSKIEKNIDTIQEHVLNLNIQNFKQYTKKTDHFYQIYEIFDNCSKEDDLIALKFAANAGFHKVISNTHQSIVQRASIMNAKLMKYLFEIIPEKLDQNELDVIFYVLCSKGDLDAVKYLSKMPGININAGTDYRWNSLMIAVVNERYETVQFLLTLPSIDINAPDNTGLTALSRAKSQRMKNILLSCGARE